MSGVAKHEKASRNAKPRRRCLRLRPLVADSFEQRQIACRLTDNRINDCSSPPSSSSSSLLSFFIVMVSFSGPLILEENIASRRRTATSPSRYFCVPFSTLPLSRRPVFLFSCHPPSSHRTSGEWWEKGGTRADDFVRRSEKETMGLEESRRTKRDRKSVV